ncbi:MAG: hypothetical protein P8123_04070 [bacterium]|jgi:hypothetical protein
MKTTGKLHRAWERNRALYLCILASALAHFIALVSVGPLWLARDRRLKPRQVKTVSLKLAPRTAARPRPPAKPPEAPPVPSPIPKIPEKARAAEYAIIQKRAEAIAKKFEKQAAERAKEVLADKSKEAMEWAAQELAAYEETLAKEEAGEVGFRRIIDLTQSSDTQISRILDYYDIKIGYGSRTVNDFNLQFTSGWLLTKGQIGNYLSRHTVKGARQITRSMPPGAAAVALRESGEGSARPYIEPTVAALGALLDAEEKYFSSTKVSPDELECLVFKPVWRFRRPSFIVARAEKKGERKTGSRIQNSESKR